MKILSKIMPYTQYFVLPCSVEELNKSVNDDSFIDIIQSAKPLVNTYVTPIEEAEEIFNSLPEKSTVFKMELKSDWFMVFTFKSQYYLSFSWGNYKGRSFCEVLVIKGKLFTQKETYRKMAIIADERQQKLRDILMNVTKTRQIGEESSAKRKSLPIWAIHAAFDGKEYENMRPFCTDEEYETVVEAVISVIDNLLPESEIHKIRKALQK